MNFRIRKCLFVAGVAALALVSSAASAIPVLQLFIEGSAYDQTTETWVLENGPTFRLWAIGNVSGPGGAGPISNVRLSAAYDQPASGQPTITLAPTRVGGGGTFSGGTVTIDDPSTPVAASFLQLRTDGSSPMLGNGNSLPDHGIYGAGTDWQEFALGNFTLTDATIADFINGFPTTAYAQKGQINAYDVTVTGDPSLTVHFDLYDGVGAGNHLKVKFAPFSHDGQGGGGTLVPEPASLALIGLGLLGLGWGRARKRNRAI